MLLVPFRVKVRDAPPSFLARCIPNFGILIPPGIEDQGSMFH